MILFLHYPKCTTCQRASNWLIEHHISYTSRHIKEDRPTAAQLKQWHEKSGLDIKRFFNTSGNSYKELQLKDKLEGMTLSEKYELLATDGMLVKRPLVIAGDCVLVGFKEGEWEENLQRLMGESC